MECVQTQVDGLRVSEGAAWNPQGKFLVVVTEPDDRAPDLRGLVARTLHRRRLGTDAKSSDWTGIGHFGNVHWIPIRNWEQWKSYTSVLNGSVAHY